ncbi:MAG: hypothetical protein QM770_13090 [Tepidisphaeraceae bacterium]
MSAILDEYAKLERLIVEAKDDVMKADGGNKAAGTRARKLMQDIKSAANDLRKKILESRQGEGGAAPAAE